MNRPVRVAGPQITDPVYGAICPVTVSTYDTLGRVSQVAAGRTPAPCSNAASDVTAIQSTRLYDDFSRPISETDPLGRTWNNRYDAHDNLVTRTDPKAQVTTYAWTTGHQLQSRTEQGGRQTTWTRNALGQPTTVKHPEANLTYAYDAAHRVVSVSDNRGNKTLAYAWSPGGWLNSVTDGEGKITNYRYDPAGRLAGITAPNNDQLTFALDPAGRLTEKRLSNGISSRYTWNADDSLAGISHAKAGTTLAANVYTYDGVGNRSANTETIGGTALGVVYSYDELKRLIQVANGTAAQQEAYLYDPLGNRTQRSVGQTGPSITAYLYDAANALKEIHSGSTGGPLLTSLAYDLNGNLQTDGTRTYTWDGIDQLAQVTNGTTTVAYAYDGHGRRTKKTVNGALTQWLHNGDQLYAEYGSSWTQPTSRWSSAGLDQPVLRGQVNADGSDGTAQYALADALGSVIALANSADSTVASQRFDAWGNKTTSTGTIPNYGYTGREPDETGLIFYRARYYHPGIGRFASRDPIGLQGGINPYAYVGNNPVMRVDPTGLTAAPPSAGAPPENYAGSDCMAMNESRLGDDPETISDAEGREGIDFGQGSVKMAAGMCYRWDDGKSSIKASPDPRAGALEYQLAPSMQDAMLNVGFGGVVKAVLGGAAKVLGLGAELVSGMEYGALDSLGRPTGISATITQDTIGTGTSAARSIIPPGYTPDAGLARGHLLGAQLGGSGSEVRNLVTIQQNPANSPVMRTFENQVRSAASGGETIQYSVTPIYRGSNPIPCGITICGNGNQGFNLGVTVLNPPGF